MENKGMCPPSEEKETDANTKQQNSSPQPMQLNEQQLKNVGGGQIGVHYKLPNQG